MADEAHARYVQDKMATVELMEEEDDDTSRLSELIALAEAGLHEEEEAEAEDELFSQAADEAEANYYKRTAEKCDAGQCSKWNEVVVEDCATDDSEDELLIDCDSD